MSSNQSRGNGKAVVAKEEDAEQEIWLVRKKVHHQGGGPSCAGEESSSLSAPAQPAANQGAKAPVEAVPVPDANVPGPQPHGGNLSIFFYNIILQCVACLDMGNVVAASAALQYLSSVVSFAGDVALQRVVLAFAEALGRRAMQLLPGLAWSLQLKVLLPPPTPAYINSAQWSFAMLFPLIRVAATAANNAIKEATAAERRVHVVDLGGANPNQWLALIRLFAARSRGPPFLRLTIVNEDQSFLSQAAGVLTQEAVRLHVPFVFNPVQDHIDRFTPASVAALGVAQGRDEALVITSTLQFHRLIADKVTEDLPAESRNKKRKNVDTTTATTSHEITKADALLRVLCDLTPKLMVLTEQDANHNDQVLSNRVRNAIDYYEVLFRDLEAAGGDPMTREFVEHMLLKEEMKNIISCEGALRRERHEKLEYWFPRMKVAGFELAAVSDDAFKDVASLAHQLSGDGIKWTLGAHKIDKGCLLLYSRNKSIFAVSAWQPAKKTSK